MLSKRIRPLLCAALLTFLAPLLLSGCTPAPVQPLRVGTNVWSGYEPLYLAQSLGWLKKPTVRMVEFTSTSDVLRAMRDHTLELAAITLDEALLLQQDDPDIRIILVMDESHGADALIAKPNIQSLHDLKGKKIGAETTALGAYMLSMILDHASLKRSDITLIPLPANQHALAFNHGRVDAVVTFEPFKSELQNTGASVLFDSRQVPGAIVDVLVVHDDILAKHQTRLTQLVRIWFQSLRYLREKPEDAARRMQPRLKLPIDQVLAQYKGIKLLTLEENMALLQGNSKSILYGNTLKMGDMMIAEKLITKLPLPTLIDGQLVEELKGKDI